VIAMAPSERVRNQLYLSWGVDSYTIPFTGSFVKLVPKIIKELTKNHKFYDLIPENKEIIKQDFLLLDVDKIIEPYKKIHIIGDSHVHQFSGKEKFNDNSGYYPNIGQFDLISSILIRNAF